MISNNIIDIRIKGHAKGVALVQQRDEFYGGFLSLGTFTHNKTGEQFVALGNETNYTILPLLELLVSGHNIENPLSAPRPEPYQPLHDIFAKIPHEVRNTILRVMQGKARPASSDLWLKVHNNFEMWGYTVGSPREATATVNKYIAMLQAHREGDSDPLVAHLPIIRPNETYTMTAEEMERFRFAFEPTIKAGAPRTHAGDPTKRISWPWAKMNPGEKRTVPYSQADKAQRAVHAYAAATGKKFITKRSLAENVLVVHRVC